MLSLAARVFFTKPVFDGLYFDPAVRQFAAITHNPLAL